VVDTHTARKQRGQGRIKRLLGDGDERLALCGLLARLCSAIGGCLGHVHDFVVGVGASAQKVLALVDKSEGGERVEQSAAWEGTSVTNRQVRPVRAGRVKASASLRALSSSASTFSPPTHLDAPQRPHSASLPLRPAPVRHTAAPVAFALQAPLGPGVVLAASTDTDSARTLRPEASSLHHDAPTSQAAQTGSRRRRHKAGRQLTHAPAWAHHERVSASEEEQVENSARERRRAHTPKRYVRAHFLRRTSRCALMCRPLRTQTLSRCSFGVAVGAVASTKPGRSRGIPPHRRDPPQRHCRCILYLTDMFLLCRHESHRKGRPNPPFNYALPLSSRCASHFTTSGPREPHKRQRQNALGAIIFESAALAPAGRGACGQLHR
jgi:hypothetical protein